MGRSAEDSRTGRIKAVDQIIGLGHDGDEDEVTRLGTAYDLTWLRRLQVAALKGSNEPCPEIK